MGKLTTYVQWVSRQMQSAQHWVTKTLTDIVGLVAIPWSALRQVFRRDTRNKAGTELRALQGMSWQAETVLVDARKRDLESLTQVELPAEARRTPLAQLPRPMLKDGWWQRFSTLKIQGEKSTATSLLTACVGPTFGKIDRGKVPQVVQKYNEGSGDSTALSAAREQAGQLSLTVGILEIILTAMMRDPNIPHVRAQER